MWAATAVFGASLAACGASPTALAPHSVDFPAKKRHTETFQYTGKEQHFTVPSGITSVKIIAAGASGGGNPSGNGNGGLMQATIPVTPGEKLAVFVGGAGGTSTHGSAGSSGYNGGGGAGGGGGGGGSSYAEPSATHDKDQKGAAPPGDGSITFLWST